MQELQDIIADWRAPYRSMDAGGSPDSAGQIGWTWLLEIAKTEHNRDPRGLELDQSSKSGTVLYRDCKPVAAYFVARDPMNFAQLFRWRAEGEG